MWISRVLEGGNAMLTLDRFLEAQEGVWEGALAELTVGEKQTHWIWFIFPQLYGLGVSGKSVYYGIRGLEEALQYAEHPVLGPRLVRCIEAVLQSPQGDVVKLMGKLDAAKLRSCLTLFEQCPPTREWCTRALQERYAGERDPSTVALLSRQPGGQKPYLR
jgi:uncharacterized protein (DUF1810 family)